MGIPVLIMGESGSGKTASLRNFSPENIGIFNVASKPLPFRKKFPYTVNKATYGLITASLQKNALKTYVIDDSQYLLSFEFLQKAKEVGFQKFTDMALHFCNLLEVIRNNTSDDTLVYLLHHVEKDDFGHVKAKTIGKMIDEKITLEGLFSIVLLAETDGKKHWFTTQSNGYTTVKSPMDMFDMTIDNDLKMVDDTIREYYELGGKENGEN